MCAKRLDSYGKHIKKIAEANGREGQMKIIRKSRFMASLVDDLLASKPDLTKAM